MRCRAGSGSAWASRAPGCRRDGWPGLAAIARTGYVLSACSRLHVSWDRVESALANASHFFGRLFPPSFQRQDLLATGLLESLRIAVLASTLGIVLSLPIGV